MASKPRFLVLGGVGFIGRNLVQHLVENDLASKIRVVDKVLPPTAFLSPSQKAAFEKVEFKQGNLVNPSTPHSPKRRRSGSALLTTVPSARR